MSRIQVLTKQLASSFKCLPRVNPFRKATFIVHPTFSTCRFSMVSIKALVSMSDSWVPVSSQAKLYGLDQAITLIIRQSHSNKTCFQCLEVHFQGHNGHGKQPLVPSGHNGGRPPFLHIPSHSLFYSCTNSIFRLIPKKIRAGDRPCNATSQSPWPKNTLQTPVLQPLSLNLAPIQNSLHIHYNSTAIAIAT